MVKRQYSRPAGGVVRGIGIVNIVHTSGLTGEFYLIDYHIYAPAQDGKTKHQHLHKMLVSLSPETGYMHLATLTWDDEQMQQGQHIKPHPSSLLEF